MRWTPRVCHAYLLLYSDVCRFQGGVHCTARRVFPGEGCLPGRRWRGMPRPCLKPYRRCNRASSPLMKTTQTQGIRRRRTNNTNGLLSLDAMADEMDKCQAPWLCPAKCYTRCKGCQRKQRQGEEPREPEPRSAPRNDGTLPHTGRGSRYLSLRASIG